MRRALLYLLELTFFGLTPDYRNFLFSQIHEVVFHGNGGYDWNTIYNMPIWLRLFTYNKLKEYYQNQNKNEEEDIVQKSIQTMKSVQNNKTITPPTYITKASKK